MAAMIDLIETIYEAAFVPERWNAVLRKASGLSNAASAQVFFFSDDGPPRGTTLDNLRPLFDEFIKGDFWKFCDSVQKMCGLQPASFVRVDDFLSPDEIKRDPARIMLREFGIGAHLCTAIPMPTGELATFVFQKWIRDGGFAQPEIDGLDALRPHLARASLVAGRLRVERAVAATSALDLLGLPAAVLSANGRVMATNRHLDRLDTAFLPVAYGGLAIADRDANRLFQLAVTGMSRADNAIGSIPVPGIGGEAPFVVHLLPLRRSAHDIFGNADILVLATPIKPSALVPSASLLNALFDLTPAEARLAADLAAGFTLAETAARGGVTVKSARTYLERVFQKTGTHRQSQLVAMLKTLQPLASLPPQ
ncbi:Regulatory protein LuxR [Mesorhizobium plurifarium]|uniref:Regulatory protein LuxR n=1 Tax=Mesorhizobium plurifarium TaxID=69974 RepID=A0A090EXV7_MESPL|nr:Regulatory protein LuxR [Mesorhizobium plurifarium]